MHRLIIVLCILAAPLALFAADFAQIIAQNDSLHDEGKYAEARNIVLDAVAGANSGAEKAELYWRAARETLELGDLAEKQKEPVSNLLAVFEEGERYAKMAISADPKNDLGYYWQSSNIGRWGQVKGILNSLFKAGPMKDLLVTVIGINPDRSDAYYVLGQVYRELPGWPVSFGNTDGAVSLGRKSVDLRAAQFRAGTERDIGYAFSLELAKSLYKRNWSAANRTSEQAKKVPKLAGAKDPLDKGLYYEAAVTLKNTSDRDEAMALIQWVIAELEKAPKRTAGQDEDLVEAREVLAEWKKG